MQHVYSVGFGAIGLLVISFLVVFCIIVARSVLSRRFYERQGISFNRTYPFIGSEVDVSDLISHNKTRDYLYTTAKSTDFIGTIRGLDIQLYAINRAATEELIQPARIGTYIDRDTPALYSFGQLSPSALTFTPIRTPSFNERKANILKGFDLQRMEEISTRLAAEYNKSITRRENLDMRAIVADWTRDVMGEFTWGRKAMNARVSFKDRDGERRDVGFMLALNETFTRLRFYSNRFWPRVYFPIATWPVTREARRLKYNIRQLQRHLAGSINTPEMNTVSAHVLSGNSQLGISLEITRDDLLTVSIAGLDTVQSTILASLWYLLHPDNHKWKDAIINSDETERERLVDACLNEAIRIDPPGSVINNKVIQDLHLAIGDRSYHLTRGTRVMPNIHALHAEYGPDFSPERFLERRAKWDPYVMPFGKGRRSCPGQTIGMMMAKNFVKEFIVSHTSAFVVNADDKDIRFNNISRSALRITTMSAPDIELVA